MKKIISILIMMISFSIVLNAQIPLSKRYGEYYDSLGRKLTIDYYGYGVFEDKYGKSLVFQIGDQDSKETNYSFKMYRLGSVTDISLIFTDKYSCIFIIKSSKYHLKKDLFFKGNDYKKYPLKYYEHKKMN